MLVGRVVDDEVDHHADAPLASQAEKIHEVSEGAEARIDIVVVGDVVAVVAIRRRMKGQQPHARNAQGVQVVHARRETREVADAVAIGVLKGLDVDRVDDRVLVPEVAWADQLRAVNGEASCWCPVWCPLKSSFRAAKRLARLTWPAVRAYNGWEPT